VDQTKFRGSIGSLLYLTAIRPDIMFSVCLCARFQSNLKESHFTAAKRIMKYLQGTINVGLWYPVDVSLNLVGYSDSASCKIDRKNTSGTCHLLGSSLVSWHNKKQACVALSTAEVEYIAAGSYCVQTLWLKQQLSDFGLNLSKIPLLFDNTSAIILQRIQFNIQGLSILKFAIISLETMSLMKIVKFRLLVLRINLLICLQNP